MNINKLFRSYKNKMLQEALLKALLSGIAAGAGVLFLLSAVYHAWVKAPDTVPFVTLPLVGFFAGGIAAFCLGYPHDKKVARRIDETGLEERIGTMLEYRSEGGEAVELQREDALAHLKKTSPKALKLQIGKKSLLTALLCVFLAVSVCLVPYDLFAEKPSDFLSDPERDQMIKDLLEELREEADNDAFDEELKEEINDIIDDLEEDLKDSTGELEDGAIIEDAKDKIEEAIDKAVSKDEIGEALQNYPLTKKLGEAISAGDTEKVKTALDELETMLTGDHALIAKLADNIFSALLDSGVKAGDDLFDALSVFAIELSALSEEALAGNDITTGMTASFDDAEEAIIAALEKQAAIEEAGKELDDTLSKAEDEALGNEKEEGEEGPSKEEGGEKGNEEPSKGGGEEGEQPSGGGGEEGDPNEGEDPNGKPVEGGNAPGGADEGMAEGIYDPVSGNTSYGKVFALYYAEYLKALENGTVSPELQAVMDAYFELLNS